MSGAVHGTSPYFVFRSAFSAQLSAPVSFLICFSSDFISLWIHKLAAPQCSVIRSRVGEMVSGLQLMPGLVSLFRSSTTTRLSLISVAPLFHAIVLIKSSAGLFEGERSGCFPIIFWRVPQSGLLSTPSSPHSLCLDLQQGFGVASWASSAIIWSSPFIPLTNTVGLFPATLSLK